MSATLPPLPSAPVPHADRVDLRARGASAAPAPATFDSDVATALRNAAKLGLSLVGTWGVALVVRVVLPRQLGPTLFGGFQFADAFTSGIFVLAGLGVETYVRKEVATRREHATDFYGGLLLMRVLLTVVLVAAAVFGLAMAGKPAAVLRLVFVLAVAQFFVVQNATLAALLHAVGRVDGLSVLSVGTKMVWGGGILVGLLAGGGVVSVAVAMLASEAIKMIALEVLVRRHLPLRTRIDLRATAAVLLGSSPFFLASLSHVLSGKLNVTLMSFLTNDTELGWYGAASSVAGIGMMLSPILAWVLLPLTARAESRSPEELTILTRRAMRLVLTAAVPISLLLGLGADVVVRTLFGQAYAPATLSLQVLAPIFVLTYVTIVSSGALVGMGRGWTVTAVLLAALVVSPALNWVLIPRTLAAFGPGGAGAGAALAMLLNEALNAVILTVALGRRAMDGDALRMLGKLGTVCLAVVALDRLLLAPLGLGVARLAADALAYGVLVVAWRAGDHHALLAYIRMMLPRRSRAHATAV